MQYPQMEVIVVDDHSTDETGRIARDAGGTDPRLGVTVPPGLPDDWFGKSWACAHGAAMARGELLYFADADTAPAPDLLPRLVNALNSRAADMISVAGRQELGSFWERVVQPQVFALLAVRYGSTERMNASRRAYDKIANGQCILIRRGAYEAVGGHGAVRDKVAEDLMLAQRMFQSGRRVSLVVGIEQLSTRMYTSLAELVRGWGKNIFAGAIDAVPLAPFGRMVLLPILLLLPPIVLLIPWIVLVLSLAGAIPISPVAAATTVLVLVLIWAVVYRAAGESPLYGIAYPLGAVVLLYIVVTAIARGRSVAWKGRTYRAA
jgi:glycosyltransferase involved in cell wall biosynthesis